MLLSLVSNMTKMELSTEQKTQIAKSCFNEAWKYVDNLAELEPWEKEMMIAAAHTSRYFWGLVGKGINFQRGEWMLTHVYSLVERGEPALHHAK